MRKASVQDAERILEIQILAWKEGHKHFVPAEILNNLDAPARLKRWQELLVDSSQNVYLKEIESTPVGFVHFRPYPECGDSTFIIDRLYVHPNSWRRGIGREMMNFAKEQVITLEGKSMALWVSEPNVAAQRFYQEIGYAPDGAKRVDFFTTDGGPPEEIERETSVSYEAGKFYELRYILNL